MNIWITWNRSGHIKLIVFWAQKMTDSAQNLTFLLWFWAVVSCNRALRILPKIILSPDLAWVKIKMTSCVRSAALRVKKKYWALPCLQPYTERHSLYCIYTTLLRHLGSTQIWISMHFKTCTKNCINHPWTFPHIL